jgi:hypothetical protein
VFFNVSLKIVLLERFKTFFKHPLTHLLPLPWGPGPGPGLGPKNMVQLEVHRPEPQILLFRKLLGTDPLTGKMSIADSLATRRTGWKFSRNEGSKTP